ncbi:MAG: M20/M25/M40 family metallo-hydrolase [Bifidobacteriaceae bacterium]|jgi:acetylornithine deacetylase/succinyl-diaminopimelate desuccinylase-like protein|nr:M20/M25/M40 family metallo-hydrolase [Bifidobacteriaceae bacterium]
MQQDTAAANASGAMAREAADFLAALIQIDTTNTGDEATTKGERGAAEFVVGKLQDIGLSPQLFESAPRRANVVVRVEGQDSTKPPLVVHQHLDVVPALGDWTHPPFAGAVVDGVIWGRGAIDMKDQVAMILAVVRDFHRRGAKPARDLILAFFADEENGGNYGSQWMVTNHGDLFQGAKEAISEAGGFTAWIVGHKVYLIETAEKAIAWMRLTAKGSGGHGSFENDDNAVAKLVTALSRLDRHHFPARMTKTMRDFLTELGKVTGSPIDLSDPEAAKALLERGGGFGLAAAASMATHLNLTSLEAGGKANVVPPAASATVDMRPLPDERDADWKMVERMVGKDVSIERLNDHIGMESPDDGPIYDAMVASLMQFDPGVPVAPFMMPGGTDNKSLARLGIAGYGFTPLNLPEGFDFMRMFHGVDERVPVASLDFGTRALSDFLTKY